MSNKCDCSCHTSPNVMHVIPCCGEFSFNKDSVPPTERKFSTGALPPPNVAWMMGKTVEQIDSVRLLAQSQELLSVFADPFTHVGPPDYKAANDLMRKIQELLVVLKK